MKNLAPFPYHHAWSHSLPENSPRETEDDRWILSHLMERRALSGTCQHRQLAAQVSSAGSTYLCRPPLRRGGRWLPTPAKWPAAHPPRCPASPWRSGAGQRQQPPSACLQAESKGREEEAMRVQKRRSSNSELAVGGPCDRFISTVNHP